MALVVFLNLMSMVFFFFKQTNLFFKATELSFIKVTEGRASAFSQEFTIYQDDLNWKVCHDEVDRARSQGERPVF